MPLSQDMPRRRALRAAVTVPALATLAVGAGTVLSATPAQASGIDSLYWQWGQYSLSPAAEDIGDVMESIAQGMPGLGYSGVQVAADVHGYKGNFFVAVTFLYISGREFWQVIACGGSGAQAEAQADIAGMDKLISGLVFY